MCGVSADAEKRRGTYGGRTDLHGDPGGCAEGAVEAWVVLDDSDADAEAVGAKVFGHAVELDDACGIARDVEREDGGERGLGDQVCEGLARIAEEALATYLRSRRTGRKSRRR